MPANIEDRLTVACANWMRVKYPRDKVLWHHSPNGGNRNAREGAKFKRMGTLAGFPDFTIAYPCNGLAGLYIELKSELVTYENGKQKVKRDYPRPEQRDFLVRAYDVGYAVEVCWNIDQFMETVSAYMSGNYSPSEYMQGMIERELEEVG